MISHEGENLVFLLCLPRSGSTILSLLLGSHSAILCPPEPWFLLKLSALIKPGNVESAFDDEWATGGTKQFLQDAIFTDGARAFAATAYNQYLASAGKTVFIDKTPRYYHILPFLDQLFPKARKIWLKRNLLDVARSYATSWGIGTKIITGQEIAPHSFDFAVGPFNLASYFDQASPCKLEVNYEELVHSPAEILIEICRFLNVQFEETMLDYSRNEAALSQHRKSIVGDPDAPDTSDVYTQSVGKWVTEIPLLDIQQIVQLLGFDIFRRMGYGDTVDALESLGIKRPCETAAAEARHRIRAAAVDKVAEMYSRLALLRGRLRQRQGSRGRIRHLLLDAKPVRMFRRFVRS